MLPLLNSPGKQTALRDAPFAKLRGLLRASGKGLESSNKALMLRSAAGASRSMSGLPRIVQRKCRTTSHIDEEKSAQ